MYEADCGGAGNGAVGATIAATLHFFAASQCLLHEGWPPQADVKNGSSFDFIIVGGGTAGAVVASRLSELRDFTVLLIEAGGDPPPESIIPGFRDTMKYSKVDWNFTTINDNYSGQAYQRGNQGQPRGKMLGGCSSINDMIYSRGFPIDYDEWASTLGEEWSWNNVLHYFKKTEHLTDERIINDPHLSALHGFTGEIEVTGSTKSSRATDKLLEAFEEMGFKIVKDMTNPYVIGAGRFSHTIRDGKRDSPVTALLNRAMERDNLFVLKDALVSKLLIENNKAYGVQVLMDDDVFHFYTGKEVIVSAGTFNTPKLLMLSGIGPREHLQEMNLDVVSDLPVGQNLHDHVMVLTFISLEVGTCTKDENERYFEMIKYLYNRSGFYTETSDLAAYISFNRYLKNVPDFALYPKCMQKDEGFFKPCVNILGLKPSICQKVTEANKNKEIFVMPVVHLKPKSRGKVLLKSIDASDPPNIHLGVFRNTEDLAYYPKAIKRAWSLVNTTYFSSKRAEVIDLGIEECQGLTGDAVLACVARSMATSAWHSVGTAAMGTVLDSRLRVLGVEGLRVADASVMPKVVRGNTNAPVVMIAEKAADFIKETWRGL